MTSSFSAGLLELWHSLAQIVPSAESPDGLAAAVAAALSKNVGAGQAGVILRTRGAAADPASSPSGDTYSLVLAGQGEPGPEPAYLSGECGILDQLATLKEPLYLSAPWPAEYSAAGDPLLQLARESLVVAPIPGSDPAVTPVLGAICLFDAPSGRLPSAADLAGLASFTGVALGLLDSRTQAARQSVEYGIVSEIGQSLTSSLSLDEIFEMILSSVRSAIDCSAISVGLVDAEKREIVFEKALMGPEFTTLPTLRLKLGQGVAGWVAETGQMLNLPDAGSDPRWYPGADADSGFVTRSILCVPLVVDDQVIGVLEAINKQSGPFTRADERLLSSLSASAAIAIEKARLHANVVSEKRRMEAIFANMGEGLLTTDLSGRITTVNPALEAMVGDDRQNLVARPSCEAIRTESDALESLLDQIRSAGTGGDASHAAGEIIRPDGRRMPVLMSGAAAVDQAGETAEIIVVFSDLSKMRELERMKEDFLSTVTHELRTPLATILLYARLLRTGKAKGDPEREARYLEIVEQESNQLQKLVRQVLDLSSVGATPTRPGRERIRLHAFLSDLVVPFRKRAQQKGLAIHVQAPADLPPVSGNREALQMVFRNLVDNAIKFSPKGKITVSCRDCNGRVVVDVADEGIGIAPESVPYLFQRFYRTEAAVEQGIGGSGLGLALVREAVEKLGGEVRVQSRPGEGTTFSVFLPAAEEREGQGKGAQRPG